MKSKLVSEKKLPGLVKTLAKKKKTIAFTNGCFDLIHPGHIKLLVAAKKCADILILGLNSDSSIRKIKGKNRPILNQKARIEILSAITCIDYITIFNQTTPLELIKKIKPQILIKGGDWAKNDIVGNKFLKSYGGKITRIKLKKGHSTSSIIAKIKKYG